MLTVARIAGFVAAALILGAESRSFRDRAAETAEPRTLVGAEVRIGEGTARMFVEVGADAKPKTIGITFGEGALRGMPMKMNSTSRCFDKNRDGQLSHGECMGDYQFNLALPDGAAELGLPFKYATVNWNPEGHMEPAPKVWSAPHYDFHFYIVEPALIDRIRSGPCAELIDCDD